MFAYFAFFFDKKEKRRRRQKEEKKEKENSIDEAILPNIVVNLMEFTSNSSEEHFSSQNHVIARSTLQSYLARTCLDIT